MLAEIQASMNADAATGDDGKAQDSANDTEGIAVEVKEKTHGKETGTEEDGVAVRYTRRERLQESGGECKGFRGQQKRDCGNCTVSSTIGQEA